MMQVSIRKSAFYKKTHNNMSKQLSKLFIILLPAICVSFSFSGCIPKTGNKEVISVSIQPIQYFVDRLTEEKIPVNVMVPSGVGHDTYSPTPQQFQKLSNFTSVSNWFHSE